MIADSLFLRKNKETKSFIVQNEDGLSLSQPIGILTCTLVLVVIIEMVRILGNIFRTLVEYVFAAVVVERATIVAVAARVIALIYQEGHV